jgi:hypothetical protein
VARSSSRGPATPTGPSTWPRPRRARASRTIGRSTFVSEGKLRTETILNRALRGVPYVPIDMARQMNLIPEATYRP